MLTNTQPKMKQVTVDSTDRFKYHLYDGEQRVKRTRTMDQLHLVLLEKWKKENSDPSKAVELDEFKSRFHVEIYTVSDKTKEKAVKYIR